MCLAIPARVESIHGIVALVTAFGCKEQVDIRLIPSARVGDLVLIHGGFALQKVEIQDAATLLAAWDALSPKGEANNE